MAVLPCKHGFQPLGSLPAHFVQTLTPSGHPLVTSSLGDGHSPNVHVCMHACTRPLGSLPAQKRHFERKLEAPLLPINILNRYYSNTIFSKVNSIILFIFCLRSLSFIPNLLCILCTFGTILIKIYLMILIVSYLIDPVSKLFDTWCSIRGIF